MKHFIALTLLSALGQEPAKEKPPAAAQETPKRFVRSFLDARDRNLKSELELLVAEHGILPAASDKALPADQALKRLRELVDKMSDAKARDGLAKAPHAKTADGLQAMAAAAALSDNKIGALAALLTAVEKFPANVDARANLAGMAATLGLAAEALAVLDKIDEKAVSTSGMGVPGRSIVLAIRGHALVSQHRYAEAKDVLKQALTAAPQLSEAGLNLAIALQKLGEKDEAKRVFFAAAWRSPPSRLVCGGGNDQFTGDPFKDSFGDDVTSRLPASKILDLSKGVAGTFPKIPFSSNLEELETFAKWAELEGKKVAERVLADQKEYLALAEKVGARKQTLSERRARDIHSLIGVAEQEPELKKIWLPWENRDDLRKNLNSLVEAGQKEWLDLAQSKLEEAVLSRS